jgi:phage repressor protein C with HTH and peptisase S24 domain
MRSVGDQAREYRLARGWNTRQMAEAVGTSRQNIENLEAGDARKPQYIVELARAMGTTVDVLLAGTFRASSSVAEPHVGYSSTMQPILAWEHQDDLPAGEFVMIPRLNVHLSAGGGREQVEIEFVEKQPQAFRADWVRKKRLRPSKLASMVAVGDSMEDRIHDGDAVVVDTSQTEVLDGKVYALWYEGGERIKRLYRLPGGGLRIHSDNVARHPEIVLASADVEHVRIIGRVVHVAGEGGL